MSNQDHVIIDQACGCKVSSRWPPNTETTLHLCAWHSRWIRKANTVTCAGEIQETTHLGTDRVMIEQAALTCENGHELTGECDDDGRVTAVRARGAGHRRSVVWAFVDCAFCPLCGAEIRQEHGNEIGVVRA